MGVKRKIDGPSTIIFWWKAKTLNKSAVLRFLVDEQDKLYILGNTKWEKANFSIPSGSHWIEWKYVKLDDSLVGRDTGWIDETSIDGEYVPCDLYYADLCDWDTSGDGLYGAIGLDVDTDIIPRMKPELSIGKLPASTEAELNYKGGK